MFSIPDRVCKFVANMPRFGRLHPRLVRAIIRSSISCCNFGARNWTKDMTILTLEAIEADPWNAVKLEWPADADRAFLSGGGLSGRQTVRRNRIRPVDRCARGVDGTGEEELPDIHEYNKARWLQAEQRMELIAECYREAFQAEIDPP